MVDKFKYQHSHILELIYDAHKNGEIDQNERLKIKRKLNLYIIYYIFFYSFIQ